MNLSRSALTVSCFLSGCAKDTPTLPEGYSLPTSSTADSTSRSRAACPSPARIDPHTVTVQSVGTMTLRLPLPPSDDGLTRMLMNPRQRMGSSGAPTRAYSCERIEPSMDSCAARLFVSSLYLPART